MNQSLHSSAQQKSQSQRQLEFEQEEKLSASVKAEEELTRQMEGALAKALIFLSIAWFFLTVGVFTVNPVGPVGIFSLCVGIPCVIICITYFIRYERFTLKILRQRKDREAIEKLQKQAQ
ncbi:hypothetical protein KDH_36390 [Dictyobacter sp. S3.2.2.5]|uniref:Uncharacterized protein n=1 Tax=Dictyobacter halimunensis TaxID=3026934 RepID=A0ABQ6FSZ8_9CHLR|nr:hypothetical protein KDH_36390 [Dictyobacter sp. S3.2.2.5]